MTRKERRKQDLETRKMFRFVVKETTDHERGLKHTISTLPLWARIKAAWSIVRGVWQ